jgi:uncharacterized tellurite resistance protein B-like protein
MFEALNRLFTQKDARPPAPDARLAVAALLVHLAAVDGAIKPEERVAVRHGLTDFYGLEEDEVERLVAEALRRDADAVDFYQFTSELSALDNEERLEIARMMWQVVCADSKNHELEDNMVWRIAELIGVSTRDRNIIKNQMARR